MKGPWKSLAAASLLVAGALGYGYWHAVTHATLYLSLHDRSAGRYGESVKDGTVELFDAGGELIMRLVGDSRYGVFNITFPGEYDCHAQEQAAARGVAPGVWQECFRRQSRWLARVAPAVARADLRFGRCERRGLPVSLSPATGSWYWWWVPLPHVGGTPYSSIAHTFYVDGRTCAVR
jgi:hypothetical protein